MVTTSNSCRNHGRSAFCFCLSVTLLLLHFSHGVPILPMSPVRPSVVQKVKSRHRPVDTYLLTPTDVFDSDFKVSNTTSNRGHCVHLHRIMPNLVHLIQAQQRRPLDAVIATGTRWFVKMQRMAVLVNPQRLIFLRPRCHSTCPKQSFVYTILFVTCVRAVVNSKSPFHSNFATAASIAFQSGVNSKPMYG